MVTEQALSLYKNDMEPDRVLRIIWSIATVSVALVIVYRSYLLHWVLR